MKYIVKEEDRHVDCIKKFVLVSNGCEIIRIPKFSVQRLADEETATKLEQFEPGYPSDTILFQIYRRYHDWRSFREKLVDDISSYQSNIGKALNKRSSTIPKIPRIGNRNYSRIQSPVQHWNMLVDNGHIQQYGKFETLFTLKYKKFRIIYYMDRTWIPVELFCRIVAFLLK